MNLKQLLHKIEAFAKKQKFVNSVSIGDINVNWNGDPNKKYGAVNIDIPQIIVNDNMQQMQVYLYYADRLAHDHSNEYDVKTTAELVLNNIINYCAEIGDVNEGWTISFFTATDGRYFADELTGGYVSFYLEIEKPFGECLIDDYKDEDESLIELLKEAIKKYEEENAQIAEILKEILHKLTGEYNMFNISFKVDGEIYDSRFSEDSVTLGEIKPNDPAKEGFIFNGWDLNGQIKDDSYLIDHNTIFNAAFESIKVKCDFYNFGYHSQYSEITDPDVLLQVLNDNYEWVSEVNDNTKTFGRAISISGDIYNSVGLASNNYSGYMDITVSKDVKILLASSNNAGTKKTADVYVDDEHIYYDNVNILYDYDLVQNDYIPTNIEQYNIIDVKAGSRVIISTPKNKQINVIGIYVEHKDTKTSRTIKQQADVDEYTIAFYGANDGNDLINVVDENEHLEAPDENCWNCITDSSFVFGITPVTQNLEFEME